MSSMELMKAINEIDDRYISLAYYEKKVTMWKPYKVAMVCCLVTLFVVAYLVGHIKMNEHNVQLQMNGGGGMKIYVQKSGEDTVFTSLDGAVSWSNSIIPEFYMILHEDKVMKDASMIPIVIHNNSDSNLITEQRYSLYVWKNNSWVLVNKGMFFTQEAYWAQPTTSYEMSCNLYNIQLESGRYLISKPVVQDKDRSMWVLSVEFIVE